jgi:type IV secretory pathway TraG/TraD family ATPase VirD4
MDEPLGNAKWSDAIGFSPRAAQNGLHFFFGHPINMSSGKVDSGFACEPNSMSLLDVPNGHLLTVAPTRAGKGVSLIIPNLLCYRGSTVVIDPKGENAWITAPRRRQLGHQVEIVDPWGEVNRRYGSRVRVEEKIARFNPLSVLKPGADDFLDNLAYLADSLIITESSKEPYFDDTARELWAGLMAYVVENPAFSADACLALARKLLMRPNDELRRTIDTAVALGSESIACLKLAQFADWEKVTGVASVISTARTQTAFLDDPILARNMATSDFSFDDLREGGKPTTVYLVLAPDKLATYARWLRLMVSIAIGTVQRGPLEKKREPEQIAVNEEPVGVSEEPAEIAPPTDEATRKKFPLLFPSDTERPKLSAELEATYSKPPKSGGAPATPRGLAPLTELPESLKVPPTWREKFVQKWKERVAEQNKPIVITPRVDPRFPQRTEAEWKAIDAKRRAEFKIIEDKQAALDRGEGIPVLFLLDEFGTIGKLAAVSKAYGLMAGLGMVMWAFVQDLNQLNRYYPDEWQTFIGNVTAMTCFGMMDQFTVEYVSKMLGTKTVRYQTTSRSTSENTRIIDLPPDFIGEVFFNQPRSREEPGGHSTSQNTTDHVVAQPLASPDDIRRMGRGGLMVIRRGDPVLCQRIFYYDDKDFSGMARPDPKYQNTSP